MRPDDLGRVTEIHRLAFPEHFLTSLGSRFLRTYYGSVVRDSEAVALVATTANGPCGLLVGSPNAGGFYTRLIRRRVLSFAFAALPGVIRRPSSLSRVLRALRHPSRQAPGVTTFSVFSLAVSPQFQGRGIGSALMSAAITRAQTRSCTLVALETDASDNGGVLRLYQHLGFNVVDSFTTREGRAMLRLARSIDSSDGSLVE